MKNIKRNLLICLLVVFCSVALAGCNNKVKDELAAANDKIAELEKQLEEANANKDSIAKQLADAQTALKAAEDNEAAAKNELDALKDKYMDTLEKVCKKELVFTNLDELFGEADATGVYTAETGTTYNLNVALVYTYTPEGADEPTFTSEEFELNKDDVVLDYINTNKIAVISGPTFAVDIIKDVPIGLSLGTTNELTKKTIMQAFINPKTKLRPTLDIIGIEVCGAIKNVMAIASGMLEGMNVPDSTKALFLTEALNDIKEIIDVLGGNKKTILSFAGFGDILMTCTSPNSRNFTFGKILGSGKKEEAIKYRENTTVEGLYTLKSIQKLLQDTGACIPIIDLIYEIIYNDKDTEEMLKFLIEK